MAQSSPIPFITETASTKELPTEDTDVLKNWLMISNSFKIMTPLIIKTKKARIKVNHKK